MAKSVPMLGEILDKHRASAAKDRAASVGAGREEEVEFVGVASQATRVPAMVTAVVELPS